VRPACAVSALERREPYGIWGGLDRADRKRIAARFDYLPPGDPPPHGTNSRRVKWGCSCPECRAAQALYESMRRERKRLQRDLWRTPLVLAAPVRCGRVRALPGQLVLPLRIGGSTASGVSTCRGSFVERSSTPKTTTVEPSYLLVRGAGPRDERKGPPTPG
jgi:hypothetical protein